MQISMKVECTVQCSEIKRINEGRYFQARCECLNICDGARETAVSFCWVVRPPDIFGGRATAELH